MYHPALLSHIIFVQLINYLKIVHGRSPQVVDMFNRCCNFLCQVISSSTCAIPSSTALNTIYYFYNNYYYYYYNNYYYYYYRQL